MFKEINDIKCICETLIEKSEKIKKTADEVLKLLDLIKAKASQEEALNKSLAMRKELSGLFILNSNLDNILQTQQKIFESLKSLS